MITGQSVQVEVSPSLNAIMSSGWFLYLQLNDGSAGVNRTQLSGAQPKPSRVIIPAFPEKLILEKKKKIKPILFHPPKLLGNLK